MNEKIMRKHYETTPKEILIDILISSRKEFDKLQNKNKECKQEIERLQKIIFSAMHYVDQVLGYHLSSGYEQLDKDINELYGILMGVDKE